MTPLRKPWLHSVNNDSTMLKVTQWLLSVIYDVVSAVNQYCHQRHCSVSNDSAVSTMTLRCQQWLHSVKNGSVVLTVTPHCKERLRGVNNDSAVSIMVPRTPQSHHNSVEPTMQVRFYSEMTMITRKYTLLHKLTPTLLVGIEDLKFWIQ
jgi:hypothetical protein